MDNLHGQLQPRSGIPLDIIYSVIDELVLPTHPLSYQYEPSIRGTLRSLLFVCRDTYTFTRTLLYSRICVRSLNQLVKLSKASLDNLNLISSLYISIDEEEAHNNRYVYRMDGTRGGGKWVHTPAEECIDRLTDSLALILRTALPSVRRLAIGLPNIWRSGHHQHYWRPEQKSKLSGALATVLPNLAELALIGLDPVDDFIFESVELETLKLNRICVSGNRSERVLNHLKSRTPALEYICFVPRTVQRDTSSHVFRMIESGLIVERVVLHLPRTLLHTSSDEGALRQWAADQQPPIELILDRSFIDNMQFLFRSGIFWDRCLEGCEGEKRALIMCAAQ